MNKRGWIIPILIVVVNALAVILQWSKLPEVLPAHFDLEGNASGSISRSMLPFYPLAGAAFCLITYLVARIKNKLYKGLIFLSSGICLVLFISTLVTLTTGTMPVFMLAEPVVLLAAIFAFIICLRKQ